MKPSLNVFSGGGTALTPPVYDSQKRGVRGTPLEVLPVLEGEPIALVSMPWGSISRPSIGLGILKQCANRMGLTVDVHYLNMRFARRLGINLYYTISENSAFFPEWFFSCALFGPTGLGLIKNSVGDLCSSELGRALLHNLETLGSSEATSRTVVDELIPRFIGECLDSIDWSKYKVIGFSNIFAQTLSSLLLAKRIKERYPEAAIIFGGANMDSEMGFEIIRAFDWVDYVVHGEAERSFQALLRHIIAREPCDRLAGVSMRRENEVVAGYADPEMIADLDESPIPDYSDFFREAERVGIANQVRMSLNFESSRGCWWGAKAHCTFCGLNGQTMAFRKKSPLRVYKEIMHLASQYRCLRLNAVDNILDLDYFETLLPELAEANLDLSLFYEVKASMSRDQVRRLAAAGVTRIQPGIESFNTGILRMMRKGVTAIQNIQLLKWCLELGIEPYWNILYGFPGESPDHYAELPAILRLLFHLRPPEGISSVKFERFSPYHFEQAKFKLRLKPLSFYSMIYPRHLVDYDRVAYYFEGDWDGRQHDPAEYIRPSLGSLEEWRDLWSRRKIVCEYEKGPDFLTVYDSRPLQPGARIAVRKRNLSEIQSRIYVYCDEIRSFKSIHALLSSSAGDPVPESRARLLLDQFVASGLIFREGDRYLSLAVRKNGRAFSTSSGDH